jgi:hypothetical protein
MTDDHTAGTRLETDGTDDYWKQEIIFDEYGDLFAWTIALVGIRCLKRSLASSMGFSAWVESQTALYE